jgi:hypothetical protein
MSADQPQTCTRLYSGTADRTHATRGGAGAALLEQPRRPPALWCTPQATNDARNRKGMIGTFLRGSGKKSDNVLTAQQDLTKELADMIEDTTRNAGTQVGAAPRHRARARMPPPHRQHVSGLCAAAVRGNTRHRHALPWRPARVARPRGAVVVPVLRLSGEPAFHAL